MIAAILLLFLFYFLGRAGIVATEPRFRVRPEIVEIRVLALFHNYAIAF